MGQSVLACYANRKKPHKLMDDPFLNLWYSTLIDTFGQLLSLGYWTIHPSFEIIIYKGPIIIYD